MRPKPDITWGVCDYLRAVSGFGVKALAPRMAIEAITTKIKSEYGYNSCSKP